MIAPVQRSGLLDWNSACLEQCLSGTVSVAKFHTVRLTRSRAFRMRGSDELKLTSFRPVALMK